MTLILLLIPLLLSPILAATAVSQALPGCPEDCGNVSIPYPFGLDDGCSKDRTFLLSCNRTLDPPRPFWRDYEVREVDLARGEILVLLPISKGCYNQTDSNLYTTNSVVNLTGSPFTYSDRNRFTLTGCATTAYITNGTDDVFLAACASACNYKTNFSGGCSDGIGCCQSSIPKGLKYFDLSLSTYFNMTGVWDFNPCSFGFVADPSSFLFNESIIMAPETYARNEAVVLDWSMENQFCSPAQNGSSGFLCPSQNSRCIPSTNTRGSLCSCNSGYEGNPYLEDGCQDIDECKDPWNYPCRGSCTNTPGGFNCYCPPGTQGNATTYGCSKDQKSRAITGILAGIGGGVGFLLLLGGGGLIHRILRRRRAEKLRQSFLRRNRALLSIKMKDYYEDDAHGVRTFSLKEMEKATDNFDGTRIVGSGGQGTVYKGLLLDKRVAAIKRFEKRKPAKEGDEIEREIEQFVNEIAILSRINHRNVVTLLGCCLETEVPLLVYEFVANGTLGDHLHRRSREGPLSWDDRLRIATEITTAVTYMHSAASRSIFHRDLKSANILLDEKLTAKVSDFGASKSVTTDQTHITTAVQGTYGYLDPEYHQTGVLTEKRDVYSLGVILVELLTGGKPSSQERSAVAGFKSALKEDRVLQIVEPEIKLAGKMEEVEVVVKLAEACLKLSGDERPMMWEVESKLQGLRKPGRSSCRKIEKLVENRELLRASTIEVLEANGELLRASAIFGSPETSTTQFKIRGKNVDEENFLR